MAEPGWRWPAGPAKTAHGENWPQWVHRIFDWLDDGYQRRVARHNRRVFRLVERDRRRHQGASRAWKIPR